MQRRPQNQPPNPRSSRPRQVQPQAMGIYKLPSEILGQIFVECLPSRPIGISYGSAPLQLLHVCPLWKDVALKNPALWTTLDFTYPFRLDGPATFRTWLNNSGTLPLAFIYETNDFSGSDQQELELMRLLLSHIGRFHTLKGSFGETFWDVLLQLGTAANPPTIWAPILKRFDVRDKAHLEDEDAFSHLTRSIRAPVLRSLVLRGPWFFMTLLDFDPRRLRRFCLTEMEYEMPALPALELIHNIRLCTNLQELELTLCEEICPSELLQDPELITLTRLRRLKLWIVSECDMAPVFMRKLVMPGLRHLEIGMEIDGGMPLDIIWLNYLLERPLRQLRSLSLSRINISIPGNLPEYPLWSILTLEILEFKNSFVDPRIPRFLTPSRSARQNTWILPSLSDFTFRNVEGIDWNEVVHMMSVRVTRSTIVPFLEFHCNIKDQAATITRQHIDLLERLYQTSNGRFHYRIISPNEETDSEEDC
ncbi:hypothetical protein M422DRAFT_255752 [Sphaerobolus stellatus SS14]|uniref:F-box domain-containing protein n=1 Tax=Sphaerobolus stellatus (strain SS14) TaxID=990650 RepID=A0A0C9VT37_SPHS4|nr:hypothetical protein M422DRAFT_255752 [Sphaerobolus stellatus SS14]